MPALVPPVSRGAIIQRNTLIPLALLLLAYYGFSLHWSVAEIARCLLGMALLWAPLGALLYVVLRRSVEDPMVRLALSYAGSYTLTTLLYFVAASLGVKWFFIAGLLAAAATAVWLGDRHFKRIAFPRLDPVLLAILAGSLVVTIPYSSPVTLTSSGNHTITGITDHFYHVGLEYELSRHVPPLQATIRGGTPERAYHMFPHLTVMLIARFTGQPEMLRAHSVYHYAAITVLICLALYGIGFLLTASKTGGYVCAFLPFLFAIAMQPVLPNGLGYFFFTWLPHATSSVYPTLWTSPQMFSGVAVIYGVLLGIAAMIRTPLAERGNYVLPAVTGLMIASLLRFRVHCWLAACPVFLVFVLWRWYESRQPTWLISTAVTVLASVLLFAEMSLPAYMRGTTDLHFAFNGMSGVSYLQVWPFSTSIHRMLQESLSGAVFNWTWQIVCLTSFVIWDVVGIPICIAVALVPAMMKRSHTVTYYLVTMGIVVLSLAFATCLTMGYDAYSVPAQLLYHVGWYALPLAGIGVAWFVSYIRGRIKHAWLLLLVAGLSSGIASAITQRNLLSVPPKGPLMTLTPSAWDAYHYVKEGTPGDAIILSSDPNDRNWFMASGLGARSSYLDSAGNPVDSQALKLNPKDNRALKLGAMAAARNQLELCAVVTSTPITHIVEEATFPIMPNLPCLQRLWTGPDGATRVWQVVRR